MAEIPDLHRNCACAITRTIIINGSAAYIRVTIDGLYLDFEGI